MKEGSDIDSLTNLKGRKVATLKGSLYDSVLKQESGINLVLFDTETEGLRALAEDRVDAFVGGVYNHPVSLNKERRKGIKAIDTPLQTTSLYFAVNKGNEKLLSHLNHGFTELKDNGEYDRIYRKWFVE